MRKFYNFLISNMLCNLDSGAGYFSGDTLKS